MSVITATDPDHLDIYGTEEAYLESFRHYTTLIQPGGALIIHKDIALKPDVQSGVKVYTYARTEGDFHAENIRIGNGEIFIDFVAPDTRINDIQLGVPVSINIENGVAAMALAHLNGVTDEEIRQGMNSFSGVDRRFVFKIKNDQVVYLSDYAHHPSEIKQSVLSIRELYKDKKITAIFQPHLYTRTRAYYQDFAEGMRWAVVGGTCRQAQFGDIEVCGKTGTAQNPHGRDHSAFMGFAPMNNPKIAICVYVENAGFGATFGVPIGGLMMEKYLTGQISPHRQYIEDRMLESNTIIYSGVKKH